MWPLAPRWLGPLLLLKGMALVVVAAQGTWSVAQQDIDIQGEEDEILKLNISSPEPTELLVSWTFETNETIYFEVMWSPPDEDNTTSATTNDTWYTITGLTPCTRYTVSITVLDFTNQTLGLSDNETTTTASPVTNVSSVAIDGVENEPTLLDVSWKTQDDLTNCSTNFSVMWARLDDTEQDEVFTADFEYTISGLDAFTSYNVCVATCLSDALNYPVCGVNNTKEDVPGQPAYVTAKPLGSEALWVGWEEPVDPNGVVIGYTLIWTHAATRKVNTLHVDGNTTTAVISGLEPCTAYTITVSASTTAGSGQQGGPASATTETAGPGSPREVIVSQVDGEPDTLTLTWTQANVLGHCQVTSNTVTWWLAASGDLIGNQTFPATEHVNLTELQPSTTYSVAVSAAVQDIPGPSAGQVNATTARDGSRAYSGTPPWVVGTSVTVVVVIVVVAVVVIYLLRKKLRMSKARSRACTTVSQASLGLHTLPPPLVAQVSEGQVRVVDLRGYIKRLEDDTQRGLEEEFEQVQQSSGKYSTEAATHDNNKPKNRFRNILPFDHSRVILSPAADEANSDYINANHIKDAWGKERFVACQGPKDGTIRDLWRLVWQVDARIVVMLTNLREKGRERCAVYWPFLEEPTITVGGFTITRHSETGDSSLRVRELLLLKDKEQRPVRQYHLTTWPDFGVPSHEHHLLDFIREVRNFASQTSGPLVVHCSAGVGRTGTFIGLWNLMDAADAGHLECVNVKQTVMAMRECRCFMVQTPEQYLYLYKCIAAYLEEPHRWRTKDQWDRIPRAPPPPPTQGEMLAYDNPAFTEEATSDGHHASSS